MQKALQSFKLAILATLIVPLSAIAQSNNCSPAPTTLPVNASCTNTAFAVNTNGTTQNANASCATGTAYEDGWYLITATSGSTTITVTGPNQDMCLAAWSSCASGQLACTMIASGGSGSITFATTSGTQYYIQIQRRSGNNNADLSGNICATAGVVSGGSGSLCTSAVTLLPGSTQCGSNTSAGSFSDSGTDNPCNSFYNDGEYWFTYTATTTQALDLDMTGLTATYSGLFVLTGCPGSSPTCVASAVAGSSTADYSLTTPSLVVGQTYYIVVANWSTPYSTNFCLTSSLITVSAGGNNSMCGTPDPICSGSPIAFVANTGSPAASTLNPGNNYNCLSTSPNPSWYYLEIDQSGNLAIDITAGSDVDFALWGPFANLTGALASCNAYAMPTDCSYSTSAVEQANAAVLAGQTWVLLVTNYANTTQVISINEAGSNTASTNCAIVPLPVGYTHWGAQYIDRKAVLTWSTDIEEDNEQFIVQRSKDGLVWETIGTVAGNGNSSDDHDYQYIDETPLQGISYYRLMQVDFNGTASYTSILSVNTDKTERFAVYPNPAKNNFHVLSGNKHFEKITITNTIGKSFDVEYTTTEDGISADCSKLSPGIYTLTLVSGGTVQSERLLIQE